MHGNYSNFERNIRCNFSSLANQPTAHIHRSSTRDHPSSAESLSQIPSHSRRSRRSMAGYLYYNFARETGTQSLEIIETALYSARYASSHGTQHIHERCAHLAKIRTLRLTFRRRVLPPPPPPRSPSAVVYIIYLLLRMCIPMARNARRRRAET